MNFGVPVDMGRLPGVPHIVPVKAYAAVKGRVTRAAKFVPAGDESISRRLATTAAELPLAPSISTAELAGKDSRCR